MRIILAAFIALIVSGDEEVIRGNVTESVLLPCPCSNRNLTMDFKWQMEKPNRTVVFKYNKTTSKFYDRYEGRAKTFLDENRNNCSLLLTNVTAEDQGTYRCIFYRGKIYMKPEVHVNVFANYEVCKKDNKNIQVFHCEARGRYKEAKIQWHFNGKLLTNSPKTYTTPYAVDGLHHFNSKLETSLKPTSNLTCDIKAKGVSTIISYHCQGENEPRVNPAIQEPKHFMAFLIVPIVLVIALFLFLWHRWKVSQRLPKIREVETDNIL